MLCSVKCFTSYLWTHLSFLLMSETRMCHPPKLSLWHKDYFELEANEINRCRKKPSWLKAETSETLRTAILKSPLPGQFYGHEEDRKPRWTCTNQPYSISCPYVFTFSRVAAPESLKLFSFVTSLEIIVSLRCYISPSSNRPFELLSLEISPEGCALYV